MLAWTCIASVPATGAPRKTFAKDATGALSTFSAPQGRLRGHWSGGSLAWLVPRFFSRVPSGALTISKMLYKLMRENYYHWIRIFVVFTPTVHVVQTLSKCSKVDVCKCSTDEGTIDLWSLAGTASNIPRFGYDPTLICQWSSWLWFMLNLVYIVEL